ncbi:carboxymuconolactone decarboxylase family protein [Pseudooceanicola sp. 216_PA32_1]|uniref:Carboxymuconolactone decarboxylase family protein n=1 Tax=Pseudooceanicola pacificus TaxID=2676438 RepID=A0A844W5G3_9RHOB|nr:carboxymuconolactone decarboxylase family protein [Pseudooceanicola pacificus]MWB79097.1 carboxymuconolactone decarboxylase family protein [Pseudooceanicola pacificus]
MTSPSERPAPIPDESWPDEIRDLRNSFAGGLNVYRVMAHHPALLRAWAPLRQHVVKDTALGQERSEIVILRVGVRLGSSYEWAHHVARARALGMPDARISAVRGMPEGEDGLLVRAVDAILDDHRLPGPLEQEIAAAIGREAVFDIIATVGFYSVLGAILMTYDVPLDAAIDKALTARPIET